MAVKLTSWVGPLLTTLINEATKSLRTAVLSSMLFYVPALLVMSTTDFDTARAHAQADPADVAAQALHKRPALAPAVVEGAPLLIASRPAPPGGAGAPRGPAAGAASASPYGAV